MPLLRSTLLVDAPLHTVAAAVRESAGRLLAVGDEMHLTVLRRVPLRTRITRVGVDAVESERAAGPLPGLRHATVLAATGAGTRVTDEIDWRSPLGPLGTVADLLVLRRLLRDAQRTRMQRIRTRAGELATAPAVVGAAIVAGGCVLAAQRSYPAQAAGRWELPGGRVEAGETEQEALTRECKEELGVKVQLGGRLGPDVPLPGGLVLRVYTASLERGEHPTALEHRALRQLRAGELDDIDWLDTDRVLLPDLRALFTSNGTFAR